MPQWTVLRTKILEGSDWAEAVHGSWHELVSQCTTATPFQTWEWQTAWFRHFGGRRLPHLWSLWEGDDLVGLYPMVRSSGFWTTLRPMGCGPSDYLHPIARIGSEGRVAEALTGYCTGMSAADLADLHQVRETHEFARAQSRACDAGSRELCQATCLVLELPRSYEDYVTGLSKSLRYDVRRLEKQGAEGGRLSIESVSTENAQAGMDALFDCHLRRWRRRGLPGVFLARRTRRFHKEWADLAVKNDWLRLSLLKFEGETVGAIYAMALGSTAYFYQSGFDPVKSSISPGTMLVAHTIRNAIEEGRTHFDFMRGDEAYKRRWKPQRTYRNLRFLIPGKSFQARLAKGWNGAGFRMESGVRARLEGKGLV